MTATFPSDAIENPLPELRSDEYRDVVAAPPPLLARAGLVIFAILLVLAVMLGWVVPYPETIGGSAELVATHYPTTRIAHASGTISRLAVRDDEAVRAGHALAIIADESDAAEMIGLGRWLRRMPAAIVPDTRLPAMPPFEADRLGAATAPLLAVQQRLSGFNAIIADRNDTAQSDLIGQTIARQEMQLTDRRLKLRAAEGALAAAGRVLESRRGLVARGIVVSAYLDQWEADFQARRENVADARIELVEAYNATARARGAISVLRQSHLDRTREAANALARAIQDLRTAVFHWEDEHILRAPGAGKIRLLQFWHDGQTIRIGDRFAVIEPFDARPTAIGLIAEAGAGKVRIGQPVTLDLAAYPAAEWGWLRGTVASIGGVPIDGRYRIGITLSHGLVTSTGRRIRLSQQMRGKATISTTRRSLLGHLLGNLFSRVDKYRDGHD